MRRALLAAAAMAGVAASPPTMLSTAGGVYSDGQALEGAQIYTDRCAMCHGPSLAGTHETPGLTGKFAANWARAPLGDLYDYIGRAMPQSAPGTLTPDETAKLVAYLLKANAMPAGSRPLAADKKVLDQITFVPVRAR